MTPAQVEAVARIVKLLEPDEYDWFGCGHGDPCSFGYKVSGLKSQIDKDVAVLDAMLVTEKRVGPKG